MSRTPAFNPYRRGQVRTVDATRSWWLDPSDPSRWYDRVRAEQARLRQSKEHLRLTPACLDDLKGS